MVKSILKLLKGIILNMSILSQLNSLPMYLICGAIILFVALACLFFMIRAYKAGVAVGLDKQKLKTTITASATFAILPSIGILLGVIALSGSLGTPLPWLRLSVIGALHYETQVAEAAAEQVGITLSASQMTPRAFVTIALLMSVCIMWGMVFSVFFTKKYSKKLMGKPQNGEEKSKDEDTGKKKLNLSGFGDMAMTAMFIGLVSAYIGSYIGQIKSEGNWISLAVAVVGGLAMALFIYIKEKKDAEWIDSFSIAGSMLIAMAAAIFLGKIG